MEGQLDAGFASMSLGAAPQQGEGAAVDNGVMRIGRRCYVGNLSWSTSWQDLKDAFNQYGTVVYANVTKGPDGRSKGWGIVEFQTPEQAVNACATMNGTELNGRNIIVREDREDRDLKVFGAATERPARPRRAPRVEGEGREASSKTSGLQVVVQNLPWTYSTEELQQLMAQAGEVGRAEIMIDRNGRSKGYGTVRYSTEAAANNAIQILNGTDVGGRNITVKLDKFE